MQSFWSKERGDNVRMKKCEKWLLRVCVSIYAVWTWACVCAGGVSVRKEERVRFSGGRVREMSSVCQWTEREKKIVRGENRSPIERIPRLFELFEIGRVTSFCFTEGREPFNLIRPVF